MKGNNNNIEIKKPGRSKLLITSLSIGKHVNTFSVLNYFIRLYAITKKKCSTLFFIT